MFGMNNKYHSQDNMRVGTMAMRMGSMQSMGGKGGKVGGGGKRGAGYGGGYGMDNFGGGVLNNKEQPAHRQIHSERSICPTANACTVVCRSKPGMDAEDVEDAVSDIAIKKGYSVPDRVEIVSKSLIYIHFPSSGSAKQFWDDVQGRQVVAGGQQIDFLSYGGNNGADNTAEMERVTDILLLRRWRSLPTEKMIRKTFEMYAPGIVKTVKIIQRGIVRASGPNGTSKAPLTNPNLLPGNILAFITFNSEKNAKLALERFRCEGCNIGGQIVIAGYATPTTHINDNNIIKSCDILSAETIKFEQSIVESAKVDDALKNTTENSDMWARYLKKFKQSDNSPESDEKSKHDFSDMRETTLPTHGGSPERNPASSENKASSPESDNIVDGAASSQVVPTYGGAGGKNRDIDLRNQDDNPLNQQVPTYPDARRNERDTDQRETELPTYPHARKAQSMASLSGLQPQAQSKDGRPNKRTAERLDQVAAVSKSRNPSMIPPDQVTAVSKSRNPNMVPPDQVTAVSKSRNPNMIPPDQVAAVSKSRNPNMVPPDQVTAVSKSRNPNMIPPDQVTAVSKSRNPNMVPPDQVTAVSKSRNPNMVPPDQVTAVSKSRNPNMIPLGKASVPPRASSEPSKNYRELKREWVKDGSSGDVYIGTDHSGETLYYDTVQGFFFDNTGKYYNLEPKKRIEGKKFIQELDSKGNVKENGVKILMIQLPPNYVAPEIPDEMKPGGGGGLANVVRNSMSTANDRGGRGGDDALANKYESNPLGPSGNKYESNLLAPPAKKQKTGPSLVNEAAVDQFVNSMDVTANMSPDEIAKRARQMVEQAAAKQASCREVDDEEDEPDASVICFLCERKFPDKQAYQRHVELSELHAENLEKSKRGELPSQQKTAVAAAGLSQTVKNGNVVRETPLLAGLGMGASKSGTTLMPPPPLGMGVMPPPAKAGMVGIPGMMPGMLPMRAPLVVMPGMPPQMPPQNPGAGGMAALLAQARQQQTFMG